MKKESYSYWVGSVPDPLTGCWVGSVPDPFSVFKGFGVDRRHLQFAEAKVMSSLNQISLFFPNLFAIA